MQFSGILVFLALFLSTFAPISAAPTPAYGLTRRAETTPAPVEVVTPVVPVSRAQPVVFEKRGLLSWLWDGIKDVAKAIITPIVDVGEDIVGVAEKIPLIGGLVSGAVGVIEGVPLVHDLIDMANSTDSESSSFSYTDYDTMCQLQGGGSGAFNQSDLDTMKQEWADGFTPFDLESARAQICNTPNLSDDEVKFFDEQLTSPKMVYPKEGAFIADEEAAYQQYLPTASAATKQAILNQLDIIPGISDREKQLIEDACAGKPPTIKPDDGASEAKSSSKTSKTKSHTSTSSTSTHSSISSTVTPTLTSSEQQTQAKPYTYVVALETWAVPSSTVTA